MSQRWRGRRRFVPLRPVSALALLIALATTAAATWGVRSIVSDQEERLLKERGGEVALLLTSSIDAIPNGLGTLGGILKATRGSSVAFEQAAKASLDPRTPTLTLAWLSKDIESGDYVVRAEVGPELTTGQHINDARVHTFNAAMTTDGDMVATPIVGADRKLGFALGAPAAPPGTVLYRESALGPLQAPEAASSAPFAELEVGVYGSAKADPASALVSTTDTLPLNGDTYELPLAAGASKWLLSVRAKSPLVGNVAANAWWVLLVGGIAGSLLIAAAIELVARRRDVALALYASEHQVAETLQRSLLPQLPTIDGLDLCARYLAGGQGQEVGGDWFDAFPVDDGRVGIAVGDVIGHDLAAASAMAQIRAALRAYALDGGSPHEVLDRLAKLVDALGLAELVTVFYGLLDAPAYDGSRRLTYANAGHLAPLLREPDGTVRPLDGGGAVVIGAPGAGDHRPVEEHIPQGATMLLFTDGLVEVPGQTLDDAIDQVAAVLSHHGAGGDLSDVCDNIVAPMSVATLRDDVALLAIRVGAVAQPLDSPLATQSYR